MKKDVTTKKLNKSAADRRKFLKTTAAVGGAALGSGLLTGFPTIWAQNIKNVTLRQFGTGVSNINEIAKKVKEDLGSVSYTHLTLPTIYSV